MNKLKKGELLDKESLTEECELAFNSALQRAHDLYPYRWNRIDQAKEEIVALIKKEAERDEIEASYIDIVIDLYDQLEQKKPQVTEEFVKKWMNIIRPETPVSIKLAIKDMLKEAGVSIA